MVPSATLTPATAWTVSTNDAGTRFGVPESCPAELALNCGTEVTSTAVPLLICVNSESKAAFIVSVRM